MRAATAQPTELQLKVITVNLHKGFTAFNRKFILPELRNALRAVHADIVFLQEVIGDHEQHPKNHEHWPATSQYEYLADTIWADFAYGRNAVYPEGHHGNALLSKFPIVSSHNLDATFSKTEKRGLLHCCLALPGHAEQIHTVCIHLGLRERHRQRQLELLCALIADLPKNSPLIVAGDFNDWRSLANQQLAQCAGLEEIFSTAYGAPLPTFPARWSLLRLDRIYVRNVSLHHPLSLSVRPWSHLSDHAPLAADLVLAVTPTPVAVATS